MRVNRTNIDPNCHWSKQNLNHTWLKRNNSENCAKPSSTWARVSTNLVHIFGYKERPVSWPYFFFIIIHGVSVSAGTRWFLFFLLLFLLLDHFGPPSDVPLQALGTAACGTAGRPVATGRARTARVTPENCSGVSSAQPPGGESHHLPRTKTKKKQNNL